MDSIKETLIERLFSCCVEGLELLELSTSSGNDYQNIRKNLNIWGYGLIEGGQNISLGRRLCDMDSESLSQYIIGTLADIASIIDNSSSLQYM